MIIQNACWLLSYGTLYQYSYQHRFSPNSFPKVNNCTCLSIKHPIYLLRTAKGTLLSSAFFANIHTLHKNLREDVQKHHVAAPIFEDT